MSLLSKINTTKKHRLERLMKGKDEKNTSQEKKTESKKTPRGKKRSPTKAVESPDGPINH